MGFLNDIQGLRQSLTKPLLANTLQHTPHSPVSIFDKGIEKKRKFTFKDAQTKTHLMQAKGDKNSICYK